MRRRLGLPLAAVAVSALIAACTSTLDGEAHTASSVPTGGLPPAPTPPGEAMPSFGESATLIESRRLAFATPRPDVIDESFSKSCHPSFPAKSVEALSSMFLEDTVQVLTQWGFVAAYMQCMSDPENDRSTLAAAIEMRDEEAAKGAVLAMVHSLITDDDLSGSDPTDGPSSGSSGDPSGGGEEENDEVVEPLAQVDAEGGYSILDETFDGKPVMETVVPKGRLVLYQWSEDPDGTRLVDTTVSTLESALERAGEYEATELDRMPLLKDDPRNLRSKLYQPEETFVTGGGYSLQAFWGIAIDPVASTELLRDNGFTAYYSFQGEAEQYGVYELSDFDAAKAVMQGFADIKKESLPDLQEITVPGVPEPSFCEAHMIDGIGEGFPAQRCSFASGKYLFSVDAYGFEGELTDTSFIAAAIQKQLTVAP